ncbi:hypothetical protein [Amycolatopsis anabasis]|uniref:hypothetical protein n=1 Tax=Amycolatopsis anabasis TaxID=1840409 RepID=UPI00131C3CCD|nr:hypothetical protein [Amycolatopsis anabasis]
MWVDESGGTETTDTGASGEMEVTVEGQEYTAQVNFDIDEDGTNDTVRIENEDGTITGYTDTDGDGDADQYLHIDAQGNVLESARFDEASGDWIATDGGGQDSTDSQTSSSGGITADMREGDVNVGPATVDSNHDGTNDTAVVEDSEGNTRMFTDVDGDGKADVQTIITPDGETHTYNHTGDGEWTEVPGASGVVGGDAAPAADSDAVWGGGGHDTVEGVAKIDSATGQWISQN